MKHPVVKIEELDAADMTSNERRTYYVLEWLTTEGYDDCAVMLDKLGRTARAVELQTEHEVKRIITYDLIADGLTDVIEAQRSGETNSRLQD